MLFDRSRLFSLVIFHETQSTFASFVSLSISATRSTLRSAVLVIVFAECSGATWQAAVGCDKLLRSTAAHVSTLPRSWNNYQQTLHVLSWTRLGKTYAAIAAGSAARSLYLIQRSLLVGCRSVLSAVLLLYLCTAVHQNSRSFTLSDQWAEANGGCLLSSLFLFRFHFFCCLFLFCWSLSRV